MFVIRYLCMGCMALVLAKSCSTPSSLQTPNVPQKSESCNLELALVSDVTATTTVREKLYSICTDDRIYIWNWRKPNDEPHCVGIYSCGEPLIALKRFGVILADGSVLAIAPPDQGGSSVLVQKDIASNREIKHWDIGGPWDLKYLASNRGGTCVACLLKENSIYLHTQKDRTDFGDYKIGVIRPEASIQWVGLIREDRLDGPRIGSVHVSDDGKFMACVGTTNGGWLAIGDTEKKRILWQKTVKWPDGKSTVSFNECSFSPDSTRVYVAGNTGLLGFDILTGQVICCLPTDGRFVSVDVSPDGHLVAGGESLVGYVKIFDLQTGRMIRQIETGQYTIYGLTFSPDSKYLATSGVKNTNVKIWKLDGE
jgi:WD40 repeat protein